RRGVVAVPVMRQPPHETSGLVGAGCGGHGGRVLTGPVVLGPARALETAREQQDPSPGGMAGGRFRGWPISSSRPGTAAATRCLYGPSPTNSPVVVTRCGSSA